MSTIQAEVVKSGAESTPTLLRRFTRKVQEASIVTKVRGKRYNERKESKLTQKKNALKKLAKRENIEKLKKMGKIKPRVYTRK